MSEILQVNNLKKYFPVISGLLKKRIGEVKAVDGVDFRAKKKETFALVGESGSGKTTVGKMIIGINKPTQGSIVFDGIDITTADKQQRKHLARRMQMIYQDPTSSLNPRRKVRDIVIDPLNIHNIGSKEERIKMTAETIEKVGLPIDFLHRYPHELSVGQKQRVGIARAVILNPDLLVLDEPTSALDVSVQANVTALLKDLQELFELTYVFISHNLALVRNISDRVAVMYLGRFMEKAATSTLYHKPLHPYTVALLSVVPTVVDSELEILPKRIKLRGEIPSSMNIPPGCRFASRCSRKMRVCIKTEPEIVEVEKGHEVRCHMHACKTQD